ncbi:hypothetical protein F4802DRAFT_547152 [Xylaria palmicola]|nr:hypothetical protein F4802DRAFT_547152 [Xylaria palmicola]
MREWSAVGYRRVSRFVMCLVSAPVASLARALLANRFADARRSRLLEAFHTQSGEWFEKEGPQSRTGPLAPKVQGCEHPVGPAMIGSPAPWAGCPFRGCSVCTRAISVHNYS